MPKQVKTAVVGVGALGQHHLRWLNDLEQSELVGFYDSDPARSKEISEKFGVKAFDSVAALADEVELVSIVVPTSKHFEIASELIERGLHCLIEKPVTTTVEQAHELTKLADKQNVKITVGQIERFNPAVRAVVEKGAKPSFIEAHRMAAFNARGTDVAVVLDLMIHDIDLALMLTGSKPIDIQASAVAVISDQADIANARLTFENGAVANLTASRISLSAMRKIRLFQKAGYYSLDLAKKQADLYSLGSGGDTSGAMRLPLGESGKELVYRKVADDGQDMLGAELAAFVDAVQNDKPVVVTLDEATEALRVALEVERIGRESLARMLEV